MRKANRPSMVVALLLLLSAGCGGGEDAPCAGAPAGTTCNDGLCWNGTADGECDGDGQCRTTPSTTGTCVVFLTSDEHDGDLGGLAGADAMCQRRARDGGLTGTFRAWLSDSRTSAAQRLTHAVVPYVDTQGHMVAASWVDLTDGGLRHEINHDQYRYEWSNCSWFTALGRVWTGTRDDGSAAAPFCDDWSEGGDDSPERGRSGYYCEEGSAWSDEGEWLCSVQRSLYCFQQ
jgi:hypothetical protein